MIFYSGQVPLFCLFIKLLKGIMGLPLWNLQEQSLPSTLSSLSDCLQAGADQTLWEHMEPGEPFLQLVQCQPEPSRVWEDKTQQEGVARCWLLVWHQLWLSAGARIQNLWTGLSAIDQMWLPLVRTWFLNESHYGVLTGINKAETSAKHGKVLVKIARLFYDVPSPPLAPNHPSTTTLLRITGAQTSLKIS